MVVGRFATRSINLNFKKRPVKLNYEIKLVDWTLLIKHSPDGEKIKICFASTPWGGAWPPPGGEGLRPPPGGGGFAPPRGFAPPPPSLRHVV